MVRLSRRNKQYSKIAKLLVQWKMGIGMRGSDSGGRCEKGRTEEVQREAGD